MAIPSQTAPPPVPMAGTRARPPQIALVLGSGGVRSAAAIGIAEVLVEAGLRPGLVVGCSSGALFGALVAMQIRPAQALEMAVRLWSQDLTTRRRWRAYFELLLPRLAGFDAGFGLRDSSLIAARIAQAFGSRHIEDLPTELRVVTTEAASGRRVVLERGLLVDALRASMAVPFIFPAVEVDGRRLIDGMVCDPLPAAVAGAADVVVTLGFEGTMPRRVDRPSRLLGQLSTALMNNLMQARLDAARAAGQTLVPIELPLDRRIGLWETAAMPHIYRVGREAALQALPNILDALHGSPGERSPAAQRAMAGATPAAQ